MKSKRPPGRLHRFTFVQKGSSLVGAGSNKHKKLPLQEVRGR